MLNKTVETRMLAVLPPDWTVALDEEAFIHQAQCALGVVSDGVAGQKTLSALWKRSPPQADEVVGRAFAALDWPRVTYSMSANTGLGERWLTDSGDAPKTGDCSDFACHCLGLPKDQTAGRVAPLVRGEVWLGADALAGDAIGPRMPLAEARPGDLVVYAGAWAGGKRTAIGHVEVCVEARDGRVWTVGCASSNRPSAIVRADKTALWRRKGAAAVRPRWYTEGA